VGLGVGAIAVGRGAGATRPEGAPDEHPANTSRRNRPTAGRCTCPVCTRPTSRGNRENLR
jgi:hypothetical protein